MTKKRKAKPKGAVYGLFDEYQATQAVRYNGDIVLRQSRGEITLEQARAFYAPMPSEDELRKRLADLSERLDLPRLEALSDAELDSLEKTMRQEGCFRSVSKDIQRERNKRKGK